MRKGCGLLLLLGLVGLLVGCSVSPSRIGVPLDNAVAQVGVGVKILPKADEFTLMRISPMWLGDDYVALANLSAVSFSDTNNGVAVGGLLSADEGLGVSLAAIDHNCDHIGVRIGGVVCGKKQRGLQLGLFTSCSADSTALQIGLLNFVEGRKYPMPLFNFVSPAAIPTSSDVKLTPQQK